MTDTNLVALADHCDWLHKNDARAGLAYKLADNWPAISTALRLAAQKPGREEIRKAIVEYCLSQSSVAVQNSHGDDRIYYSGLLVDGLVSAILALPPSPAAATDRSEVERLTRELASLKAERDKWDRRVAYDELVAREAENRATQQRHIDELSIRCECAEATIAPLREALRKIADPEFWAVDFEGSDEDVNERRANRGTEAYKVARAALSSAPAPAQEPAGQSRLANLARQFDLMAKGCRSMGLDSFEDDYDALRQRADKGDPCADEIVEAIDYDYRNGHDGRAAAKLLVEALAKDIQALYFAKAGGQPAGQSEARSASPGVTEIPSENYLSEVLLDFFDGDDAGRRSVNAARAVLDYIKSEDGWPVRNAIPHPTGKVSGDAAEMRERCAQAAENDIGMAHYAIVAKKRIAATIRALTLASEARNG